MKKWTKEEIKFVKESQHLSRKELGAHFSVTEWAIKRLEQRHQIPVRRIQVGGSPPKRLGMDEKIIYERQISQLKETTQDLTERVKEYQRQMEQLEGGLQAAFLLTNSKQTHSITAPKATGGEATIVALLSDAHVEEQVLPAQVNGTNEYNLELSRKRMDHFFSTLLYLIEIQQKQTKIDNLVLGLLGDFITNSELHPEFAYLCLLQPGPAMVYAQELLESGIKYLLDNSDLKITIVCHSGNHARITEDKRFATEHGFSLEWIMYSSMANHFKGEKRLTWIISESYHSYVNIYDMTLRFHHGSNLKYGGGIGGLTIPTLKAIAQWNTVKHADIDCFGDKHTAFDGMNFVSNGSVIGYNGFAVAIKAPFQEPMQMVFGIHSKLGRYVTLPIKFRDV